MKNATVVFALGMVLLSGIVLENRGGERKGGILPLRPNPEDTILYDAPPPVHPLFPIEGYFAVRFTPVAECTVKAAVVSALMDTINPPACSLIVWDDFGGMPGFRMAGTPIPFIPSGYPTFDRINLPISYVDANDFWIGIFVPGITGFGNYAFALSDSVDGPLRSYYSENGFLSWCQFPSCGFGYVGDLLIRAIVEYSPSSNPDVGVVSIDSPPDTVYAGFLYPVRVSVANFGDGPDSFPVVVNIPMSSYEDTTTVSFLAPGDSIQVSFEPWLTPDSPCDTPYTIIASTLLETDINPNNDTRSKDVFVQCVTGISEEPLSKMTTPITLFHNEPNPFSQFSVISFQLSVPSYATLKIYDLSGSLVRTLVDSDLQITNYQSPVTITWDGRDESGRRVNSGIYFVKLHAYVDSRRVEFTDTIRIVFFR